MTPRRPKVEPIRNPTEIPTGGSMPTPESSLEALANRVAKLEVQNRRLRKTGIALLIVAAAVIVMGQAPTRKVIEANEFVLKDADGKTRAWLGIEQTVAQLGVYGPEGKQQGFMHIGSGPYGPFIILGDGHGKRRASLDLQSGDNPTLFFQDASGSTTASLSGGDVPLL
jgi:hypothetical protein